MNRGPILTVVVVLAVAFVAASVFAYYPFQLVVQPVEAPVVFQTGSNANRDDLGTGKTIAVSLGSGSTSATVRINPTYQTVYYKDVLRLQNTDSKAYSIYLVIDAVSNSLPSGSRVWLIVFSRGATRDLSGYPQPSVPSGVINSIELINTISNTPQYLGVLSGSGTWDIDFMVYIPEGATITSASATFNMHIVYTPSSETPP